MNVEKLGLLYTCTLPVGIQNVIIIVEQYGIPKQLNTELYNPAILLLGIYPKELKAEASKDSHSNNILIAKRCKRRKFPLLIYGYTYGLLFSL